MRSVQRDPRTPYLRAAYWQAAAMLIAVALAVGCEVFVPTPTYQATELPDDVTELFETAGDPASDTVWIYEQGGPIHELDAAGSVYDELGIYRGKEDIELAMAHQTLTLNHDLAARYRDLSLADLQAEVDVSVEILHRTIEHFRAQGKRVVVIGHSYGAFLVPRYLWRHGPDGADRYLIMAGRLDMPMVVVNAFLRGSSWYFPDAVTPAPPPPHPELTELTDRDHIETRIAAATGYDRYTERLAETDLRRVVYVFGTEDMAVGRLTAKEVDFLASRGARVIPVGGGHGSMFEDPRVIQKISVALQE